MNQTKDILRESIYESNYENSSHKRLLNLIALYSKLGRIKELKEMARAMADNLTDADIDGIVRNSTTIYTKDGKQIKEEDVKGQEVIYKGPFVDEQGNRLSNDEIRGAVRSKEQAMLNTIDHYRKIVKSVDIRYNGRLNIDDLQEVAWLESQLQNWGDRAESMAGDVKSVIDDVLDIIQEDMNTLQTIVNSTEEESKEHKQAVKDLEDSQGVYNNLMQFRNMSEKKLARKLSLRQDIHGHLDNSAYEAVLTIFEAINNLKKTGNLSEKYNEQDLNDILVKLKDLVVLGKLRQAFMAKLNNYLSKPTEIDNKVIKRIKDKIADLMKSTSVMFHLKWIMAVALLVCLFHLPYGFYVLIRFAAMVVFGVMAYQYYKAKNNVWMVTFGALALLFQPLVKISLDRETWNVVDVVVAGLLFHLLWKERK